MLKSGKQWPIFIAVAIFGIVILGYWTIKETMKADLTESNLYMSYYQNVDDDINSILEANIAFDREYRLKLDYLDLDGESGKLIYSITDKKGKPVDDAAIELLISRPTNDAKDIALKPSEVKNGKYIFKNIHLPKVGKWHLLLKVQVGGKTRYLNLKADTRSKEAYEF